MDTTTIIVTALATGAANALRDTAEQTVKDAYASITRLLRRKYKQVDVAVLESDPTSTSLQAAVKAELGRTEAGADEELLLQAKAVLDAVWANAPESARAVGVSLEDIKGAALVSSQKAGATGAVCQDAPSMRIAARGAMRLARLGNWHAPETRS